MGRVSWPHPNCDRETLATPTLGVGREEYDWGRERLTSKEKGFLIPGSINILPGPDWMKKMHIFWQNDVR